MSIILFEAIQRVQRLGRGLLRYISNELSGFDSSPLLSFEKDTKFYLIQSKGGFAHEPATAEGIRAHYLRQNKSNTIPSNSFSNPIRLDTLFHCTYTYKGFEKLLLVYH